MAASDNNTLVLVDGSSYLYRAYHALPPLTNSKGEQTGAVYGVVNMLRRLIAEQAPRYIAIVFDAKGKTFRDELYTRYKAHRPPMPDDLAAQIERLYAVVEAMGLPILSTAGFEADDIIGTLATQAREQGVRTLIVTGDKDLAQLVDDSITLVNTMNNTRLDRDGVMAKFGVRPEQIIDYLALVGDTSDNIPGVPKVGPKTAVKWLREYGSIDEIVARADEIRGKVGENLRANIKQLKLSRELATIHCGVPLDVGPLDLGRRPQNTEALCSLYKQLEFQRLLEETLRPAANDPHDNRPTQIHDGAPVHVDHPGQKSLRHEIVTEFDKLEEWIARLQQARLFAFDVETTSLDYMNAEVVGVSFATDGIYGAYVPLTHDYDGAPPQLDRALVLERLKPLLESERHSKLGHNLKYDRNVLFNHDICLRGIGFDTMLEAYVLNSTLSRHDLDSLALKYLAHRTIHYEDVAGKGARQLSFNQVPVEQAAPYAAEDATIAWQLHEDLWPRLEQAPALRQLLEEIEIPLIPVLSDMERHGVLVDTAMLEQQSSELAATTSSLEKRAFQLAEREFNLASPKQLQEVLFDQLGLPVITKTPTGQPSTSEAVLQELALDYPLPALILEYRTVSKLKSTYTDRLPKQINSRTGRIHTSYHQAVTATGRLSSSDPNLQNIPIRSPEGRRIRRAFIAAPGYTVIAADYSQIELRIMAHFSSDEGLCRAFRNGEDIHRATAAEIFGIAPSAVTAEQRRSAKAINFGLIYGMSPFGLARQLRIERKAAQEYMDSYFGRYPKVKTVMDELRCKAREQGYVETLFGRRLYLPEIRSPNAQRRQYAERAAINAPLQGSAADIIKKAMLDVHNWIQNVPDHAPAMIMQVHDELVFEVADEFVEQSVPAIRECMINCASLSVPLVVDIGTGPNWDEAH